MLTATAGVAVNAPLQAQGGVGGAGGVTGNATQGDPNKVGSSGSQGANGGGGQIVIYAPPTSVTGTYVCASGTCNLSTTVGLAASASAPGYPAVTIVGNDPTPVITSVTPPTLVPGQTANVVIAGQNFGMGGTVTICLSSSCFNPTVTSWNPNNSGTVSATIPGSAISMPGTYTVQVTVTTDLQGLGFQQPPGGQGPQSNLYNLQIVCPTISVSIVHPVNAPLNIVDEGNGRFFTQLTAQSNISGTYVWTVSNPSQVQEFDTGMSVQGEVSQTINPEFLTPGVYTLTVTLTAECGTATASITIGITPVIGALSYVDKTSVDNFYQSGAGAYDLANVNFALYSGLETAVSCSGILASWTLAGANADPTLALVPVTNNDERLFSNYFVLDGTANPVPPTTLTNPTAYPTNQYRAYNQFQATFEVQNGAIIYPVTRASSMHTIGTSPEPCFGSQIFSLPAQTGSADGANGEGPNGSVLYQAGEGRLGSLGQDVNFYLNKRTFTIPEEFTVADASASTPYIWTSIQFDANGNWIPLTSGTIVQTSSIFPTIVLYKAGSQFLVYPQQSPETFISLDSTYAYSLPQ